METVLNNIWNVLSKSTTKWVLRWMSRLMASIDVAMGATIGWVLKQLTQDWRTKKP